MTTRRVGVAAGTALVLVVATAWGLGISVLASRPQTAKSTLPGGTRASAVGTATVVARMGFGDGPGDVGLAGDGDAVGARSFAVDDRERIFVLDPLNARVLRFDAGVPAHAYTLPDTEFDDIAVAGDRLVVLARTGERKVLLVDTNTGETATLPVSEAVPDVYRVFIAGADVVVECPGPEGRTYHTVGGLDGVVAPAPVQGSARPGETPLPTGDSLTLSLSGGNDIAVDVVGKNRVSKARLRAHSDRRVAAIIDATSDMRGNLYITWAVENPGSGAGAEPTGSLVIARYSPEGELTGRAETPNDSNPEPLRRICVTPAGDVYQLTSDASGARVVRWKLQP